MSIKVKIETAMLTDVLAVPLRAVHQTADGWLVKLRADGRWHDRAVKLGASNSTDVVVAEGLKAGDRIAAEYTRVR